MKKSHGPAFRKEAIDLAQCSVCRGKAVITGIFHEMECAQCSASGWVAAATGEALPPESLALQLSLKLQQAQQQIDAMKRAPQMAGPAAQYQQNNRRGAGGSNFTGD